MGKALHKTVVVKSVKPDATAGMTHMQMFSHLIKAGPSMHGAPGSKKKGG